MESIERLMELEIEDLYFIIGKELHVGLGIDSNNNEVLVIRGKRWLKDNYIIISEKICHSFLIGYIKDNSKNWETSLTVAAVADFVVSLKLGVSPVVVSILVVKLGLDKLCEDKEI